MIKKLNSLVNSTGVDHIYDHIYNYLNWYSQLETMFLQLISITFCYNYIIIIIIIFEIIVSTELSGITNNIIASS